MSQTAKATVTNTGRAALVKAVAARPLMLAWGTGELAWDEDGATLPSLVNATRLTNEIGRRLPSYVGFALPDENGEIVVSKGVMPDGTVLKARYRRVEEPTPYLYVRVDYDFEEGGMSTIREIGMFMDSVTVEDLPPGQRYFLPHEIQDPGLLLAAQIFKPAFQRSPAIQQGINFVLPL